MLTFWQTIWSDVQTILDNDCAEQLNIIKTVDFWIAMTDN